MDIDHIAFSETQILQIGSVMISAQANLYDI